MSKVAGRMAVQAGAHCLESPNGGAGILLGGVPGVASGRTVVIGGGVVGENAIEMAIGLGSQVTVLDRDLDVLDRLSRRFGAELETVYSTNDSLEAEVLAADLVSGSPGQGRHGTKARDRGTGERMKPGSVLVDVAIDQGGASRPVDRPRTPRRPTCCTTSSTTALPTCRVPCHGPLPMPLTTQRCPSPLPSLIKDPTTPFWPMPIFSAV